MPDRAEFATSTWADRVSCLTNARHRGWPPVRLKGELLKSEQAWRAWVQTADRRTLLEVRDLLADGVELEQGVG